MRIQRFTDKPSEDILVCNICGFDEREINVYIQDGTPICAECDREIEGGYPHELEDEE